jgi:hypothetical protein
MYNAIKRLALFLLFPLAAQAGPVDFMKHQFRDHPLRTQLIFAGVASGVHAYGLHECRIVNVENCDAHYGAAWGSYGVTVGLNLVGVLVGHELGGKGGNSIAYGSSAAQLGWGAYQWHGGLNKPADWKETTKVDLSNIAILHH